MHDILSDRSKKIQPSATLALTAKSAELKAAGRDIVSLNAGEPDFDTPDVIKQAAIEAIQKGQTKYTPIEGTLALRTAISKKLARDNQLQYSPAHIIASNGAKQSIYNALLATINPGDEVIIPSPYWVSYPDMVRLADGVPVIITTSIDEHFKMSASQLEAAITPKTKMVLLNSPSNPTGKTYSRAELIALGRVLNKYPDVLILSDDIYEHVYWADEPFANIAMVCPELQDRTLVVNGVSKSYAMTGWRIGYLAAHPSIIEVAKNIQGQSTSCPCSISQAAATAALSAEYDVLIRSMADIFRQRHNFMYESLAVIPGVKILPAEGAFYAFPDISQIMKDDIEFAKQLMEKTGLILTPGTPFGAPGCIRFSYAASMAELEDAMQRFQGFCRA